MAKRKDDVGISETPNTDADERAEVTAWLRTIAATEKWRDGVSAKAGWERYVDEYKGDWNFLQSSVSIPLIPVNTVYAYVKTEIARLYFKNPWITINPKRVDDIGAAEIAEQIINYTWGELDLKRQMKMALLEALLVGHAWMKIGYVAEFGTVESQPKEDEKRGPGRPAKKEPEIETSEYIKSENVFAYHVPYKDILFDPSATYPAPHNARWMAHKIVKPLRAIKESGLYQHTEQIKPSKALTSEDASFDAPESDKAVYGKDVVSGTLYEIYDLDHMTVTTVSPGCEQKLREIPYPDYLAGGFPFVMLAFNPVPGEVYPLSDIAPHEPLIIEHQKIKAIELNHLKRWNRQILVEPDLFSPEEEAKFKDSIDGAMIKANGPISGKFEIPPYAPVQSDVYGIYNQNLQEWQMVAGQTPPDQGGQAKTQTRTLGELRLQLRGGAARSDEKVDVLEDFIEETARKLLTIMQKKYDLPKIARIVGDKSVQEKMQGILPQRPSAQPAMPTGEPNPLAQKAMTTDFSFSWNKTDILGEMDVDVVAGSTVPLDKESVLDIMMKLMPFLPAIGAGPGTAGAKSYAKELLRLIGIPQLQTILDIADETPPQPNPEMLKIQADMQAKQADVQNKQQITQAKVQGHMAEQKIKLQGIQAEQQMKMAAMQQKLEMDQKKHQLDIHKQIIDGVIQHAQQVSQAQNHKTNGGQERSGNE